MILNKTNDQLGCGVQVETPWGIMSANGVYGEKKNRILTAMEWNE